MNNALILTNHMKYFAGSEILAVQAAEAFNSIGLKPEIYCNLLGRPMSSEIPSYVKVSESHDLPDIFEYDVVWSQHSNIALAIAQHQIPSSWSTLILSVHLSPFEPMELASVTIGRLFADLFLANSHETATALKTYGVPEEKIYVFNNACPSSYRQISEGMKSLKKVLIVSNHAPAEILEAASILREAGISVAHIGLDAEQRLVTPSLLNDYDAVITIGKTVQYCILSSLPVYVYDHFGGPGWLSEENIEKAEWHNHSGRCTREKKTADQIASEITTGYEAAKLFLCENAARIAGRYILEDILLDILRREKSRKENCLTISMAEAVKVSAANAAIIRREYRNADILLQQRDAIAADRHAFSKSRTRLLRAFLKAFANKLPA